MNIKTEIQSWDTTGKIKAILLAFFCLPNLFVPIGANLSFNIIEGIVIYLFGIFGVWFNYIIFKKKWTKDITWNTNPITNRMSFFQFGALFMILIGFSVMLGALIRFQIISTLGLLPFIFGLGIYTGIILITNKQKRNKS